MFSQITLAMTGAPQQGAGGAGMGLGALAPFVLIFVIFYFLIIRPQGKEKRRLQDLLDNLKTGDNVVTAGGILGTVHSVSDTSVELKVAEKVKIKILRSAIRGLQGSDVPELTE